MNRHSSLMGMETPSQDDRTLHERMRVVESDNFALRADLKQLSALTQRLSALTQHLQSEVSHLKNQPRATAYTDMEAVARKNVERRENENKNTYFEMIDVHPSWLEDRNIPGCGGTNIEKYSLQEREAMCAAFELDHQEFVGERDRNLRKAQAKIKRVIDPHFRH